MLNGKIHILRVAGSETSTLGTSLAKILLSNVATSSFEYEKSF